MEKCTPNNDTGLAGGESPGNGQMSSALPLRYWLVDDDARYRKFQCLFLQCCSQLMCSGSFPSADAALAELAQGLPPDLILMDVSMPGTGGVEAIPLVRALAPEVRIIMLSNFTDLVAERAALASGASCCLRKSCPVEELLSAIQSVMVRPVPVPIACPPASPPSIAPRRSWSQTLQARLMGIIGL